MEAKKPGATMEDRVMSGVTLEPGSVFEAVTRQMVEDLRREIGEIKARLNGLLFMVAGAVVVDVALRLAGA
jgi:hypothetical protein